MYTPTPYFVASTASNVLTYIFYPVLVSFLTFWAYGYPIESFAGFLLFFFVQTASALMGIFFGTVIASFVTTEYAALTMLVQSLTIYYLGAGMLVNSASANWLGKFLQWISPLRYVNELAMRRLLAGRPDYL